MCCALLVAFTQHLLGCSGTPIVGYQKDGTYILERSEHGLDCLRLSQNLWGRIELLKAMPAKAAKEQQDTPPNAMLAMGRWFGAPGKGLKAVEDYDRERAHALALHGAMAQKRCLTHDIERELTQSDAAMAQFRRP